MNTIYKVCDAADCLVVGASYVACKSGRMIRFTNCKTGVVVHQWPHDVQRWLARGALVEVDDTQSEAMHAEVVGKLCHMLTSHYIY